MSRALIEASNPPAISLDDVQHFVLDDASWDIYEKLLREVGNRPIRLTYDQGRLEIIKRRNCITCIGPVWGWRCC